MANLAIYNGLLQPPKSIADYNAIADESAIRGQQMQQNALGLQEKQRGIAENDAYSALLRRGADFNTPEGMASLAREAPGKYLPVQKSMLDAKNTQATIDLHAAQSKKEQFELRKKEADEALNDILSFPNQNAAIQGVQARMQSGGLKADRGQQLLSELQSITDPGQYASWQVKWSRAIMQANDREQARLKSEDDAQKARNDVILPSGKLNTPLIEAKKQIAKAGSSNVSVTTKQEGEEAKTVGKYFGEQYSNIQKSGMDASGKLNRLSRMEQLLNGVDTGKFAPLGKEIASGLQSLGIKIDPNLGNKEAAESLSNEMALEARNPSGGAGMPGALSDSDRLFLRNIVPGLAKTPQGNKALIETQRKLAKRDQEVAELSRNYRKKKGNVDEGLFDVLKAHADKNQLFAEKATPGKGSKVIQWGELP